MKDIQVTARDGWITVGAVVAFGLTLGAAASDAAGIAVRVWLEAMLLVAPFWLAAFGWGLPLRLFFFRNTTNAAWVQPVAGAAVVLILAWFLAWSGWLNQASAWMVCAIGMCLCAYDWYRTFGAARLSGQRPRRLHWGVILLAPSLALFLVASACPPGSLWRVEAFGYDVLSYHLQLPREWLDLGAMRPLEHNVYGYFSNLMEAGFMLLGAMRGSMEKAVFASQWLHATMAMLAAALAGRCVAGRFGVTAGYATAAALLATPWTLIVGSSAYNEMTAMMFAAAALLLVLDEKPITFRSAIVAGILLGAATLAKLTAGPMFAVPIALIALFRGALKPRAFGLTACMALAGLLVLAPYLIRNTLWTNNPVFPFATETFGHAHWTEQQAQTWHAIHTPTTAFTQRTDDLLWSWLLNPGYGGLGGEAMTNDAYAMDRFHRAGGPSLLWITALVGGLWLTTRRVSRSFALVMLFMLGVQLIFWLVATKQAPRYAYFTVLPGCVLAGAAIGELGRATRIWLTPVMAVMLVASLALTSLELLSRQMRPLPEGQSLLHIAHEPGVFDEHAVNVLPPDTRTYMVADAVAFNVHRPFAYFSAWDVGPLGGWIVEADGDPQLVARRLREAGFTHVWIHWSELDRIHATIGTHDGIDAPTLRAIAGRWRLVYNLEPIAGLYALP